MKNPLRLRTRSAVALLASLFLFPGLPITPGMQAAHVFKKAVAAIDPGATTKSGRNHPG